MASTEVIKAGCGAIWAGGKGINDGIKGNTQGAANQGRIFILNVAKGLKA